MSPRSLAFPALAALVLVSLAPSGAAHPDAPSAPHVCPDLNVLFAHVHDDPGAGRSLWLDTLDTPRHGATQATYTAPAPGNDNRTFVLPLEPALRRDVALDASKNVEVFVFGSTETRVYVLPTPVRDVLTTVAGTEGLEAAAPVLRTLRDASVENIGTTTVTLNATLRQGDTFLGSAVATATGRSIPEETAWEHAPQVIHYPAGGDALFGATLKFLPLTDRLTPAGGPLTLTIARVEAKAWEMRVAPVNGTSMTLPVIDHATGPLCPDSALAPLEISSQGPSRAAVRPGQSFDVTLRVENPERVAQPVNVTARVVGDNLSVVATGPPTSSNVSVPAFGAVEYTFRVAAAADAGSGEGSLSLSASSPNATLERTIEVSVFAPAASGGPGATPGPEEEGQVPGGDSESSSGAANETQDPQDVQPTSGGRSPGVALAGLLAAFMVALAATSRKR